MNSRKALMLSVVIFTVFALFLASCGSGEQTPASGGGQQPGVAQKAALQKGDPAKGKDLYVQSCSACHGPDATGVKGLGKDMTTSEFVRTRTDEQLLEYTLKGRTPDDPLNTTGVAMPPKGGNPALTDQQIMDIIAHIRTLQK